MKVNEEKNSAGETTNSPFLAPEQDREIERYETALRLVEKEISKLREDRDWYLARIFKLKNPSEPLPLSIIAQANDDAAEGSVAEVAESLKYRPKVADLCEIILRKADRPLHYRVLADQLEQIGRSTSFNTISSSLTQDAMNRFENLGLAVFALREWPEEKKAPFRKKRRNHARAATAP